MSTIEDLKSQAKRLRTHLGTNNIAFTHAQCLEAVSAMHGHRNWNTALAACDKAPEPLNEPEPPLLVCVAPETSPDELRADVRGLLRQAPTAIRFRLDTGVTVEQVRFARSVATDVEQVGVRVEFDLPL